MTIALLLAAAGCGSDVEERGGAALDRPTCGGEPTVGFGFRAEAVREVTTGGCGEVAVLTKDGALDFFSPQTGASERVLAQASSMGFNASGDRLVGIDASGAEVTIVDTRTGDRRSVALPLPVGEGARLGVLGDLFYTCAKDILRFHAEDGQVIGSTTLGSAERCEDVASGPRGASVGLIVTPFGEMPEVVVVRSDGVRRVVPFFGGGALADGEHALTRATTLHEGRFNAFYTELREPCGDTDCLTIQQLLVLDGEDGREVVRAHADLELFGVDGGTLIPTSSGLLFLALDGKVTQLGDAREVLDVYDEPSGSVHAVIRLPSERHWEEEVVIVDARSGKTVRSLGRASAFVHADGGGAIAWSAGTECIAYRSRPDVCHSQPAEVFVEVAGQRRGVGWSKWTTAPLWVGRDGSVVVGDLRPGRPPAQAEPEELASAEGGLFLVPAEGPRTAIDLKRWGYLDDVVDLRGAAVLIPRSVGPGPYGGPDAEVAGSAIVRLRDGLADPLAKGLARPTVRSTWRPAFAIVIDEDRSDGLAYDVFAGSLL